MSTVARETLDQLGAQLSTLLSDIDAAVAARLQEPRRHERRREDTTPPRKGLRGVVTAALRWFVGRA